MRAHHLGSPLRKPSAGSHSGDWFRSYGNQNWEFNEAGFMTRRFASINELPITGSERMYFWPLGRRPVERPALSELGL